MTVLRELHCRSIVTGYLKDGKGTLGALAKDPAAYNELKAALEQLHAVTQKANTGQGALGRLLNDEELARSLAATSSFAAVAFRPFGTLFGTPLLNRRPA